jgi:predicted DNA-binding protein
MKEKSKKVPPSRDRYEKANPTVSFRLPKETNDELEIMREKEGKSNADIMKIGMGKLGAKAAEDNKIRDEALLEGYNAGFSDAEKAFKVMYPCNVCSELVVLGTGEEKDAAAQYMLEHGWGHKSCHKSR